MEVITATGRPRFIPSDHLTAGATSTMTRSHKAQKLFGNGNAAALPQSGVGGSADTSIRDKAKLLQLAEKVHTRKSASPNYTKSFRGAIGSSIAARSLSKDDAGFGISTPTVKRTNSTMLSSNLASSSAPPLAPVSRTKQENYKNPKLYASFSSKSSSKLTKALIKSDPAKTNIEHLVNYKTPPKGRDESHQNRVNVKKPPSDTIGDHNNHSSGVGAGLSSFITPLKALHASFHERSSKLGQTRSKLFSHHHQHQRDISSSNAKLLFGTQENLNSISNSSETSSSSGSSEDILVTEIISPSKHNRKPRVERGNNNKNSPEDQKCNKRALLNNTKNATSSSTLSSTTKIREQLGRKNGTTPSPPDFLDGYRNENGCNTNSNHLNGQHQITIASDVNGSISSAERHDVEVGQVNTSVSTNFFNTPDILGGCLDFPGGGYTRNDDNNGHQKVLVNGKNYYSMNGNSVVTTNGQPTQQHFSPDANSGKRKNILVQMTYHKDDDNDNNAESDSYFGRNSCNENADVWPTSPITVSTVTPKGRQMVTGMTATKVKDNTCITSSPARENEYSNKRDEDILKPRATTYLGESNKEVVANSLYAGNSLSTFKPNGNVKTGGGISSSRPTASMSELSQTADQDLKPATSNSSTSLLQKLSDEQKRKMQMNCKDERSINPLNRNGKQEKLDMHRRETLEADLAQCDAHAESTGSHTWLKMNHCDASPTIASNGGRVSQNTANKNGINGKMTHFNGTEFKKENLKKGVGIASVAVPKSSLSNGTGKIINPLQNVNGNHKRHNPDDTVDDTNMSINSVQDEERDKFSVIVTCTEKNGDERGRSGRGGLSVEAETSLRPPPLPQRRNGGSRPQTALLSDEYAQYLGYDYDNKLSEKGIDKMQESKHDMRFAKNINASTEVINPSSSAGKRSDEDSEKGSESLKESTLNMLAITTVTGNGNHKKQNGLQGIMKPQHGKKLENGRSIFHSVSFRGADDFLSSRKGELYGNNENCILEEDTTEDGKLGSHQGGHVERSASLSKFDRKKSRSLPKSFMSVKNGLRNVLPSQWIRDGLAFERLNDHVSSYPEDSKSVETNNEQESEGSIAEEALKMRWHKLGSSSSSFSDRRPKSFDYAQRKAWMKLYRDMEVSQASTSSSHQRLSRPISKGSITHLHLQETPSGTSNDNSDKAEEACECDYDAASLSTMMRSTDISSTSPSLFKRFSKTFSLRFGSGSNVSKNTGDVHQHHRKSKSKGAIGSSPDLFNRIEVDGSRDKVNGKMRKTNVKSVRGDKCQSGDSGIGMDEQQAEPRQISNLRRIRSDYISPAVAAAAVVASQSNSSYASRYLTNGTAATLQAKLSLVEIPDHSWEEPIGGSSPNEGSVSHSSDTASYEDLVDAKLDGDDGFSSSDEGRPHQSEQVENPAYYHSLPHRKHKRRLKETESTNSCGDVPQEDNSIRGKVVREIIHTEQNYVKTLNDIVQGFLNPCRARNDLFTPRTVQNIFSNIEEILRLHVKFLEALKSKVDPAFVSKSNVGAVFTSWADKFTLYSEYCCNNPISVATVRSLVQFPQFAEFFEACRRLQMMDKLPLHGFLLRPIQRICQYHLQLNELLKHTEESHKDYQYVVEALETMKSVATKINDTQRQFESLQEIIRFQNSIDGWEGPNLVDRNTVILRKGELVKVTHGRKQKEVFVAVLNKDLIYCKKDFMKKSGYVFDGRIDLNLRMWINIDSNEEDEFFGMVHNSWRIYSPERRAWILFTAPSPMEKRKWISALEKSKENIFVDPKLREMAVVTTALADSEIASNANSHGHLSNTLPKSSKKSKGKHLSVTKVDSDAMLIEVGKLKRSTINPNSNSKEGTSRFYV